MILFLIVGCIFFSTGLMIALGFLRFKRIGERVSGKVRAIEQYVSVDRDGSDTTMYKPIVDYHYRGEPRIVIGISTSNIAQKPQQDINVLVIEEFETGKITARIDSNGYLILGFLFSLMGLVAVYIYANESAAYWMHAQIGLALATVLGIMAPILLRSNIISGEDNQIISDDAILITTMHEYTEVVKRGKTVGYVIATGFLLVGLASLYWAYTTATGPSFSAEEIQNTFSSIDGFKDRISSGRLSEKWSKLFAIGGFGVFATLTSTYSLLHQKKRYRNI